MKKLVALLLTFFFVLAGCKTVEVTKIKDDIKTDSVKFHDEYRSVPKDNLYEYITYNTLMETLKSETSIVYLGFPECTLCDDVTLILNDVAKEKGLENILYYNFKEIRDSNTDEYSKLTQTLSDYISLDDENNKIITAPTIIFLRKGKVVGVYLGGIKNDDLNTVMTDEEKSTLKQNFYDFIDKMYIEDETIENNEELN